MDPSSARRGSLARQSKYAQERPGHEADPVAGHPKAQKTNKLSVAYPYTPLPESLVDDSHHDSDLLAFHLDADGVPSRVAGCAKAGVWDLRYKVIATDHEFHRYCHRSLEGAGLLVVFGLGWLSASSSANDVFLLYMGILVLGVAACEVAIHCIYRAGSSFTPKVAKFRAGLHILAGLIFCAGTTWNGRSRRLICPADSFYTTVHRKEATERIYYDSCMRSIDPTDFYGTIVAMCTLRIDIYAHPFITALHFVIQASTTIISPFEVTDKFPGWTFPGQELAARILLMAMGFLVSNLVALGKHRVNQAAFEAALDLQYQIRESKKKMEAVDLLMSTMVPPSALLRLLDGRRVFDHARLATVLFSDMVQFTSWSASRTPGQVVGMLSSLVRTLDTLAGDMEVSKIKTIGDCYWAVTGIPDYMDRHAEVMINFALVMLSSINKIAKANREWDYQPHTVAAREDRGSPKERGSLLAPPPNQRHPIQFRTGIHSGPVDAGVLGTRQISYEVFGRTSEAANEVESHGLSNRVTVSSRTKRLAEFNQHLPFAFKSLGAGADEADIGPQSADPCGGFVECDDEDEDVCANLYVIKPLDDGAEVQSFDARSSVADEARSVVSTHHSTLKITKVDLEQEEIAKAQRKKYVETRLMKQQKADSAGGASTLPLALSESTPEELTEKLYEEWESDRDVRSEYRSFVLFKMIHYRVGGQVVLLGCMLLAFLLYLTESGAEGALTSLTCTVMWVVGLMFATGSAILALQRQQQLHNKLVQQNVTSGGAGSISGIFTPSMSLNLSMKPNSPTVANPPSLGSRSMSPERTPRAMSMSLNDKSAVTTAVTTDVTSTVVVDEDITHEQVSFLEDILGPVLAYLGLFCFCLGCLFSPSSLLTNDFYWVMAFIAVLVTVPNVHLPVGVLWIGISSLALIIAVDNYNKAHAMLSRIVVIFFTALAHWLLPALNAKTLTVQFIETKVATHFVTQQTLALQTQRAVLTSMLPDFVIEPLTLWLAADFDPAKAVVQQHENTTVAFVRMNAGAKLTELYSSLNCSRQNIVEEDEHDDDDGSFAWLFSGHRAVDAVLETCSVVDKVKTVGDLVIVAGSFRGHSGSRAATAMLSVVVRIHTQFEPNSITIGLHTGAVMGIVLGFSRLSFDIFGDAVNTASRVATSGAAQHKIAASQQYLGLLPAAPFCLQHQHHAQQEADEVITMALAGDNDVGHTVAFGPVTEISAKGKGSLKIQEIQYSI